MADLEKIDRDLSKLIDVTTRFAKATRKSLHSHKEVIVRLEQRISDLEHSAKARQSDVRRLNG